MKDLTRRMKYLARRMRDLFRRMKYLSGQEDESLASRMRDLFRRMWISGQEYKRSG